MVNVTRNNQIWVKPLCIQIIQFTLWLYLFQPESHFLLHLLEGGLGCLVLVNQFVPRLLQLSEQLLHPALQLQTQKGEETP